MKFLRISRNIILVLQFLTIATMFVGTITLLFYPDSMRKYEWVGFSLLPEDEDILQNSKDIEIRFKPDPSIDTQLLIKETQVQMDGILPRMRLTLWVVFSVFSLIIFFILMQLGKMIKSVDEGDSFSLTNIRRIYSLAITLASFPIISNLFKYLQEKWVLANFELKGIILVKVPTEYLPWFLTAILLVTIGKILEQGRNLKQEQDLTI